MSMLLGKQELLHWASTTSHVHPCAKYDDLKDGLIFLVLSEKLFPSLSDPSVSRPQRNGPRNAKLNWEVLLSVLDAAGVPTEVCDRKGIAAGHQKPCYNMLVMFYFLFKLKVSSDFAVDFAHPIDDRLAAFLQSERSLECLRVVPGANPGGLSVSPAHPAPSPTKGKAPRPTPKQNSSRLGGAGTNQPSRDAASTHHQVSNNNNTTVNAAGGSNNNNTNTLQPPEPLVGGASFHQHQHRDTVSDSTTKLLQETGGAGGTRWESSEAHQHGEVVIAKLRAELKVKQRQLDAMGTEIAHVKRLGQHTMEQQRVLVESEMMRASQQFQSQLSTLKLESAHTVATAAQHFEAELESALQQIEVERMASQAGAIQQSHQHHHNEPHQHYNPRVGGGNQAELVHLRESKLALEKKVKAADAKAKAAEDERAALKEQLAAQTTVIERMHRAVQSTDRALNDSENFVLEGVNEASQALIRSRFRELGQENASLRAQVQRLEEGQHLLEQQASAATGGSDAPENQFEIAQCKQRIRELESVNAFLRKQSRGGSGGGSDGGGKDFMQETIKDETSDFEYTIPSSCINGLTVDEVSATTLSALESLKINTESRQDQHVVADASLVSQLEEGFWKMSGGLSVLRHRLDAASDNLRHSVQSNKDAVKSFALTQRKLQNDLDSVIRERQMDANHRDSNAELSQAKLEVSLLNEELMQTRRDAAMSIDRYKHQLSEMLKDSDRQVTEARAQNSKLQRQVSIYVNREQQYKQLTTLLEQRHRQPNDRQIHEAQISSLHAGLEANVEHQALVEARNAVASGVDLEGQITSATQSMKQQYTQAMQEIDHLRNENSTLRDQLKNGTLQYENASANSKKNGLDAENFKRENTQLENQLREVVDELSVVKKHFDAERSAWGNAKIEMEQYAEKLGKTAMMGGSSGGGYANSSSKQNLWEQSQQQQQQQQQKQQQQGSSSSGGTGHLYAGGKSSGQPSQQQEQQSTSEQQHTTNNNPNTTTTTTAGGGDSSSMIQMPSASTPISSSSFTTGSGGASKKTVTVTTPQPAASSSAGGIGSSVLSPNELEKRKMDILAKYGVNSGGGGSF